MSLATRVQEQPNGLAEAFIVGRDFIGKDKVALILGDNIFYGSGLKELLQANTAIRKEELFTHTTCKIQRGTVWSTLTTKGKRLTIEEKPLQIPNRIMRCLGSIFTTTRWSKIAATYGAKRTRGIRNYGYK